MKDDLSGKKVESSQKKFGPCNRKLRRRTRSQSIVEDKQDEPCQDDDYLDKGEVENRDSSDQRH